MEEAATPDGNPDVSDDYVDPPYADPSIRAGYQSAVGRLILAHNEVDFWLSSLLAKAARRIDPDGGLDELASGNFAHRATNIELIMRAIPNIALGGVGQGRLKSLNSIRNIVAHAHFDQNEYEGDYRIVRQKHHGFQADQLAQIDTDRVNAAAGELEDIARHMEAVNDFFDYPLPGHFGFENVERGARAADSERA